MTMLQQDGSRLLRGREAELQQIQQHILSVQVGAVTSAPWYTERAAAQMLMQYLSTQL